MGSKASDPPAVDDYPGCECVTWGRDGTGFMVGHHPHCPKYNAEKIAREVIEALIDAIEKWASEEDGVHPDAWGAYVRGCHAIGQWERINNQEPV